MIAKEYKKALATYEKAVKVYLKSRGKKALATYEKARKNFLNVCKKLNR